VTLGLAVWPCSPCPLFTTYPGSTLGTSGVTAPRGSVPGRPRGSALDHHRITKKQTSISQPRGNTWIACRGRLSDSAFGVTRGRRSTANVIRPLRNSNQQPPSNNLRPIDQSNPCKAPWEFCAKANDSSPQTNERAHYLGTARVPALANYYPGVGGNDMARRPSISVKARLLEGTVARFWRCRSRWQSVVALRLRSYDRPGRKGLARARQGRNGPFLEYYFLASWRKPDRF